MATNQEGKHSSFRTIAGTTLDYNGDSLAAFQSEGATATEYNSAFIQWLQIKNSSSKTNLTDLKAEYAQLNGFSSWDEVNVISGGGAFAPDDVTGLEVWLDASDATTITEVAGRVSQWDDKSGNSNNVTQGTGANQPFTGSRTENSLNVMDFQAGQLMTSSAFSSAITQGYTLYIVCKTDDDFSDTAYTDGIGGSNRMLLKHNGFNTFAGTSSFINGVAPDTSVHLFKVEFNTTSGKLFMDGSLDGSGDVGSQSLTGLTVGSSFDTFDALDGFIAELLIYDSVITGTDATNIETYLNDKWGL